MNRGIYAAALGMAASERWMDVTANNLANASTDGFKADGVAFGDALVRNLRADGGLGRNLGSLGSGPKITSEFTDMAQGVLRGTGNPLDVAITEPNAMFSVQTSAGTRYTRAGSFSLDAGAKLVTTSGDAVLDSSGAPIQLDPGRAVEIQPDGRILQNGQEVAKLGLVTGTFRKEGGSLWSSTDAKPTEARLQPKSLEGSNVNPLSQMVDLIKINRLFEMSQRAASTGDESAGKLLTILNH